MIQSFLVILILALGVGVVGACDLECASLPQYSPVTDHWYMTVHYCAEVGSCTDRICVDLPETLGGYLLHIDNIEEQEWLVNHFGDYLTELSFDYYMRYNYCGEGSYQDLYIACFENTWSMDGVSPYDWPYWGVEIPFCSTMGGGREWGTFMPGGLWKTEPMSCGVVVEWDSFDVVPTDLMSWSGVKELFHTE